MTFYIMVLVSSCWSVSDLLEIITRVQPASNKRVTRGRFQNL